MTELLVPSADGVGALAVRWGNFASWWISELRQFAPPSWLRLFSGKAMPRVFVWREGDLITSRLVAHDTRLERQYSTAEFSASLLDDWLVKVGYRRDQVAVAAALEQDSFLRRDLRVPNEALRCLPQILNQEVLRRTPFQPSEIWHEAQPLEGEKGDGIAAVCHWIIPRDRAAFLVAPLGMAVDMFDFLAAKTAEGDILPVIALRMATYSGSLKTSRTIKALAASLLGSIILGLLIFEFAQAGVATYLEEQLAGAKQAVHGGQNSSAQLTRMYALKSEPGFLAIWDELSRTLPDDTFLSEIRMSAGRLTISGYSSQAAHLVRTIDQSPIFSDATLVAAITPDAKEGKDRFRITFQLRNRQLVHSSSSFRKPGA